MFLVLPKISRSHQLVNYFTKKKLIKKSDFVAKISEKINVVLLKDETFLV